MTFIETPVFTKRIKLMLPDDEYRLLQNYLVLRPTTGKVIPQSGGLRKIRWNLKGSGKRGGLRIIYYWDLKSEIIYFLLVYRKNEQENLTANQLKLLRKVIKEYLL